jgi:hypothetical protein
MSLIPFRTLIVGQLIASVALLLMGYTICYVWDYALSTRDIKHFFEGKDATFDMLGLAVGYTYVGIVRDFISVMTERSRLFATVQLNIITEPSIREDTLRYILNGKAMEQPLQWEKWETFRQALYIRAHTDSTTFYNAAGPYVAIAIYFIVHPPLTHEVTGSFWGWATVYSVSITVLFAFILNLWFIETFALVPAFIDQSVIFLRTHKQHVAVGGPNAIHRPRANRYLGYTRVRT